MIVPFSCETPESRHKRKCDASLRKAKHLSARMKNFLADIDKSDMKAADKKKIKTEALAFLSQ